MYCVSWLTCNEKQNKNQYTWPCPSRILPDPFLSYLLASLDAPSVMIDRNYTAIVDREQFHCISTEKIITGKALLPHRFKSKRQAKSSSALEGENNIRGE